MTGSGEEAKRPRHSASKRIEKMCCREGDKCLSRRRWRHHQHRCNASRSSQASRLLLVSFLSLFAVAANANANTKATTTDTVDATLERLQTVATGLAKLMDEQAKVAKDRPSLVDPVRERTSELTDRTAQILDRVAALNRAQLRALIDRVNSTYAAEVDRRAAWDEKVASCGVDDGNSKKEVTAGAEAETGSCSMPAEDSHVSKDQIASVLDEKAIVSKSEEALEHWATSLMRETINGYTQKVVEKLRGKQDVVEVVDVSGEQDDDVAPTSENPDYTGCAGLSPAASMVFAALRDQSFPGGSELFDHASSANGGSIVYGEGRDGQLMTSKPLVLPIDEDESDADILLGDMWWRRYIPEDWEYALDQLTDGKWQEKKVDDLIPKMLQVHSASDVLEAETDIGVCYPLSLKEKSRITIRLAYPVLLSGVSISLNHCGSSEPLVGSTDVGFSVEGYQPCWLSAGSEKDREECSRTGFDKRGTPLGKFFYESPSRSKTTVCISPDNYSNLAEVAGADDDEEEESASSGQCTVNYEDDVPKSSCQDDAAAMESDAMPALMSGRLLSGDEESAVVEAVGIVFDPSYDWDCTCIHRISVYGEPVIR